jgi:exopolyphosphatase / guanosine-5'-triphosphate,3'-diphosphate pyrophosphatase
MVTRLGIDILSTGKLNSNSIDKSISCLAKFKADCDSFKATTICAVGTGALREASNSGVFIDKVRQKTGLDIKILTGEEEALFTLQGMAGLSHNAPILAIDIGGGSTEFVLSADPPLKISIPIGALKLYQQFISIDPPSLPELEKMRAHISENLSNVLLTIKRDSNFKNASVLITGGTPTTLAAIKMGMTQYDGDKIHGFKLSRSDINSLFGKLISLPIIDRQQIPGMEPERADIIISGTMIVLCIIDALDVNEITVSDYGLMEGIVLAGN